MNKINTFANFKKRYQNKWVARDSKTGRVLAAAERLKDVVDRASKITEEYSVENILPLNSIFMTRIL